jgi:hypothetical protein
MSVDCSRFSFNAWNDYLGVTMQQGKVQLDSDWNELVAQITRRIQAGTMDIFGGAVVPSTTPDGFHIKLDDNVLLIGPGRIYVDGLLAENHGELTAPNWNPHLSELTGNQYLAFNKQPYLPQQNEFPLDKDGWYLVYVDVWQREVTYIQHPELVETAIGVDTTARTQTVWQARILPLPKDEGTGQIQCQKVENPKEWKPSGGRLSNGIAEIGAQSSNPCEAMPTKGYRGLENQLYRVEIHKGGTFNKEGEQFNKPTFKWSRENATVMSRVKTIKAKDRLVVESLGRDDKLGFKEGDWVEVTDDWLEFKGKPGELAKIKLLGDSEKATNTIILDRELSHDFKIDDLDQDGKIIRRGNLPPFNTRVKRWDQKGQILSEKGQLIYNLDESRKPGGILEGDIPIDSDGITIQLEDGIVVSFNLEPPDAEFKTGDYWVFAARANNGAIEKLEKTPPRGIHHHYAKLALIEVNKGKTNITNCRTTWPPELTVDGCECTICVSAEDHNKGGQFLQKAIDSLKDKGGTVCLGPGTYPLTEPLNLHHVKNIAIRGQGRNTVLIAKGSVLSVQESIGVTLENFSIVGSSPDETLTGLLLLQNNKDIRLERIDLRGYEHTLAIAVRGYELGFSVNNCALYAEIGISNIDVQEPIHGFSKRNYLLNSQVAIEKNLFFCRRSAVILNEHAIHQGATTISNNFILECNEAGIIAKGGLTKESVLHINNNIFQTIGDGIQVGSSNTKIENNLIRHSKKSDGNGIVLIDGQDLGGIKYCLIANNSLSEIVGSGISIKTKIRSVIIDRNLIDACRNSAIITDEVADIDNFTISNNQILSTGNEFNEHSVGLTVVRISNINHASITGNLIQSIAKKAIQASQVIALHAFNVKDIDINSNRIQDIGPIEKSLANMVALKVDLPFQRCTVRTNTITRGKDTEIGFEPNNWQALNIIAPIEERRETFSVQLDQNKVAILSKNRLRIQDEYRSFLAIQDNDFEGVLSNLSVVELDNISTCIFTGNRCRQTTDNNSVPLVEVRNTIFNISNNRLECNNGDQTALSLQSLDKQDCPILGNLYTGKIVVNNSNLNKRWADLNIEIK